jgi:hypothetical protein
MVETNWEGRGLRLAVGEVSAGKHEPRGGGKVEVKDESGPSRERPSGLAPCIL